MAARPSHAPSQLNNVLDSPSRWPGSSKLRSLHEATAFACSTRRLRHPVIRIASDQLEAGRTETIRLDSSLMLLRKEVIQPHVPVRLPCYDLVPVTDPTLGSSLPEGLGH
jgi:hypothetical protein